MIGLRRPVFFALLFEADALPRRGDALRLDFMGGS